MANVLTDDWRDGLSEHNQDLLLDVADAIRQEYLLPIIGRGLTRNWAGASDLFVDELAGINCPIPQPRRLASISMFRQPPRVRRDLQKMFEVPQALFESDEPFRFLAELQLKLYLTTAYDPMMFDTLKIVLGEKAKVRRNFYPWSIDLHRRFGHHFAAASEELHRSSPLVFHLFGSFEERDSLAVTEDDHLDWLDYTRSETYAQLFPKSIESAISDSYLLLLGFSLYDWDLKVLMRRLRDWKRSGTHVCLLAHPNGQDWNLNREVRDYLDKYFSEQRVELWEGDGRLLIPKLRQLLSEER